MKNAAFAVIILCSVVAARAVPPSDESILKMMNALLQTTLDQMVAHFDAGMKAGLQQSMKEKELTPLQTAQVGQLQTRMSAILRDELFFAKVKDIYFQVYRETFTQDQVSSINAFYFSSAGKAMTKKIPLATQKASALLQARMVPVIQKIKAMQQEFLKEQSEAK